MTLFEDKTQCQDCGRSTPISIPKAFTLSQHKPIALIVIVGSYTKELDQSNIPNPFISFMESCFNKSGISSLASIYYTSALKCPLKLRENIPLKACKQCSPYLLEEIKTIRAQHKHTYLLALGSVACKALVRKQLDKVIYSQGSVFGGLEVPLFATYHPNLFVKKEPAKFLAFRDHLSLITRTMRLAQHKYSDCFYLLNPKNYPPIDKLHPDKLISIDIETYGCLSNRTQTAFHPVKMSTLDNVESPSQIETVGITIPLSNGNRWSAIYTIPEGITSLIKLLTYYSNKDITLLGQNINFDLQCLLYNLPLDSILTPNNYRLEDLLLWNFLHSENRPERSLKAISKLYDIQDYSNLKTKFSSEGYSSRFDQKLHKYNIIDTIATLELRYYFIELIARDYGSSNPKLSSTSKDTMNYLLWCGLFMSRKGISYNIPKLLSILEVEKQKQTNIIMDAKLNHNLIIKGKGSEKSILSLFKQILTNYRTLDLSGLQLTPTTKELSTKNENINYLCDKLPVEAPESKTLRLLQDYRSSSKLTGTYVSPLLLDKNKGIVHRAKSSTDIGIVYPQWFLFPTKFDNEENTGGTIQGRITCKYPAEQTNPSIVKSCHTSRYGASGFLIEKDFNQIELRGAALLSKDPVMCDEYAKNLDRHALTGSLLRWIILGEPMSTFNSLPLDSPTYKLFRGIGKTINFLILYGGKADKFQKTVMDATKLSISIDQAQEFLTAYDTRYCVLRRWQDYLVNYVKEHNHTLILPTGWSRTFIGLESNMETSDRDKILNQPVQTTAAQLVISAQYAISCELLNRGLKTSIVLNTYDSYLIDGPLEEYEEIEPIFDKHMTRPPLLPIFEKWCNNTIPLRYETKVLFLGSNKKS